jgi:hypothetical protein
MLITVRVTSKRIRVMDEPGLGTDELAFRAAEVGATEDAGTKFATRNRLDATAPP